MGETTRTLESEFTQVKTLKLMKDKVSSKGKLYFKKNNKLRWEYTSPFSYIVVLNAAKVSIKSNNQVKRYDLNKNKVFKEINEIMLSCVQGTILGSGKFSASIYQSTSGYKIELVPLNKAMLNTLSKITLYLDPQVHSVVKMELSEPAGDFTTISFTNQKINNPVGDELFTLK